MTTKEDRVQKVVVVIESILVEIADEHANPLMTAPALVEFFSALQTRLTRMSHEHLAAFLLREGHPDD